MDAMVAAMALAMTIRHYPWISVLGQIAELHRWRYSKLVTLLNIFGMAYGHLKNGVPPYVILRHSQVVCLFSVMATIDPGWEPIRDLNKFVINMTMVLKTYPNILIYYGEIIVLCALALHPTQAVRDF